MRKMFKTKAQDSVFLCFTKSQKKEKIGKRLLAFIDQQIVYLLTVNSYKPKS